MESRNDHASRQRPSCTDLDSRATGQELILRTPQLCLQQQRSDRRRNSENRRTLSTGCTEYARSSKTTTRRPRCCVTRSTKTKSGARRHCNGTRSGTLNASTSSNEFRSRRRFVRWHRRPSSSSESGVLDEVVYQQHSVACGVVEHGYCRAIHSSSVAVVHPTSQAHNGVEQVNFRQNALIST